MITKKEMIAALAVAGIVAPKKANVKALTALMAEHNLSTGSDEDKGDGEGSNGDDSGNGEQSPPPPVTDEAATAPTRETTTGTVVAPKSLKIEKDRPTQHGITRPSLGGLCRAIWDKLDAITAAKQPLPTAKQLALSNNWNLSTVGRQSAEWRKFNGMPKKAAADATAE